MVKPDSFLVPVIDYRFQIQAQIQFKLILELLLMASTLKSTYYVLRITPYVFNPFKSTKMQILFTTPILELGKKGKKKKYLVQDYTQVSELGLKSRQSHFTICTLNYSICLLKLPNYPLSHWFSCWR